MKRRLIINYMIVIAAAVLVTLVIAIPMISAQTTFQVKSQLNTSLALLSGDDFIYSDWQEVCDEAHYRLEVSGENIRFTIIDLDGTVLGDSAGDEIEYENHLKRKEVQDAIKEGTGSDSRKSKTTGKKYYYYAVRQNDVILRASVEANEIVYTRYVFLITLIIGLLVGVIFAVIMVVKISGKITKSMVELTYAAKDVAEGKYDTRIGTFDNEMNALSSSFNAMAENLQTAVSDLKHKQTQLESILQAMDDGVMQVDSQGEIILFNGRAKELLFLNQSQNDEEMKSSPALEKVREILMKANDSTEPIKDVITITSPEERILSIYAVKIKIGGGKDVLTVLSDITHVRRLEQLRSQFVSNVTHELKTPLTSIRGFVELLKSGDRDEETRRYFYDVLEIEAQRLANLINDMLSLSEIEHSVDDVLIERCNLKETLEKNIETLKLQAEKCNIELNLDIQTDAELTASASRIRQLFSNLIINAIKYNKENGTVTVKATQEGDFAVVKVIDTGIGIPEKHHERLFERFYRVDKSRSREIGGTGLGLSIVKHLVQLYNGEITLESKEGEGSTFTVKLPIALD